MKKARGCCWKYKNSPARGMTWAAELKVGNSLLCVYGQKNLKSAIAIANKAAERLGWRISEPWIHDPERMEIPH